MIICAVEKKGFAFYACGWDGGDAEGHVFQIGGGLEEYFGGLGGFITPGSVFILEKKEDESTKKKG